MRLTGETRFTDVSDIEVVGDRARAPDIIINMKNCPKLELLERPGTVISEKEGAVGTSTEHIHVQWTELCRVAINRALANVRQYVIKKFSFVPEAGEFPVIRKGEEPTRSLRSQKRRHFTPNTASEETVDGTNEQMGDLPAADISTRPSNR